MRTITRCVVPCLVAIGALMLVATAASAQTTWPSSLSWTLGVSSDETSRIQTSATFKGPIGENLGLTLGGWWIGGGDDNRAYVGDAYIDYDSDSLYVAGGRKFVVLGPAGLLVSPGLWGGELQLRSERVTVQAIAGTLAFTPVTGGTRFTYAGNRVPSDEDISAVRVGVLLTDPNAAVPITVGGNWIDVLDDNGTSIDLDVGLSQTVSLFGEAAEYNDVEAHVYGFRWTDQRTTTDPVRHTIVVLYERDVPLGFVPATVGATQYFEEQDGWAGGVYHQFAPRRGIGLYGDSNDVILTLFGYEPL